MKKQFILFSLLVALSVTGIKAQEATTSGQQFPKHEFGVSIGGIPFTASLPTFGLTLNLEYYLNFSSRHSLGVSFSTDFLPPIKNDKSLFSLYSPKQGLLLVIAPQIGYRYTYYRKDNITMYFSIFIGIMEWVDFKNWNYPFFAFQVNPFGCSIGQKNQFYFEFGCGNKGMITLGYKLGINNKNK